MRKNATKIAAMMLTLALTVTSVNIPTTSSAAAKVKLSSSKATLYVGGSSAKKTKTLKATFNGKKVKATFTSSNSKVAKVAKTTGKVTAVKKGSATITAKYKGKKAKAKITVKQYVTSVKASQTVVNLKQGEHVDLSKMITVSPASANNKALSYKSDDSLVAAVNGTGTVLKGVNEGTTSIKVTAKDGSKKFVNVRVNVTKGDAPQESPTPSDAPSTKEAKNVEISIENPFSDEYKNTLLVGTDAQVKVRVTDEDGKPVANKEVVLGSKVLYSINKTNASGTVTDSYANQFRNLSDSAKRTDSDGYVTFVFGLSTARDEHGDVIDATKTNYVSSFKLTASVSKDVAASTDLDFGALNTDSIANVSVYNEKTQAAIDAGFRDHHATDGTFPGRFESQTHGRLGRGHLVNYVSSQTVTSADGNHKVGITAGNPELVLPGQETTDPSDVKETFTFDTGKYSTYTTTTSWAKVIDTVKASKLQYATVNFGKLSLSEYSRFLVRAYIVGDPANPTLNPTPINLQGTQGAEVNNEKTSGDFSVQIPIDSKADGYLYVTAQIVSKGQVNTDVNEGFTVKSVVGVHRKGTVENRSVALKDVTVQWEKDAEATYTMDRDLPAGDIKTRIQNAYSNASGYSYQYRVPAFPRTGNAIITVYDATKRVVDYWVAPTVNQASTNANTDDTGYLNQNVLDQTATGLASVYRVSKEEALTLNDEKMTVTNSGNMAVVDSTKSGITHVIGTLTSTNPNIKIDVTNSKVYSSVQWNPVPFTENTQIKHTPAGALVGQRIVLKAKLVDKNGNPAAKSGAAVDFYQNNQKITAGTNTVDGAAVVKVDTQTNALGEAELVLRSDRQLAVTGLSARTNSGYQLGYALGSSQITDAEHVDLYWFDADLYFEPDANTGEKISTSAGTATIETGNHAKIRPIVGSHWAYEVRRQATMESAVCSLAGYDTVIDVTGLNIQTTTGGGSVGTVTDNANGKANVTSTRTGQTHLVNVLDKNSISNDVKFTATALVGGTKKDIPYVGEGAPTLNKKLTVDINWNVGAPTADFIIPTGDQADVAKANTDGVKVYVQLHDANGNTLPAGRRVKLEIKGNRGVIFGGTSVSEEVTTNELGIAEFTVAPNADAITDVTNGTGASATLVATAKDDVAGEFSSYIKWVDITKIRDAMKVKSVKFTRNANGSIGGQLALTFTHNILASSVVKEQFTVKYGNVPQNIGGVTVANDTVTINLTGMGADDASKYFEITIADAVANTMQYKFVSADGQFIDTVAGDNVIKVLADGRFETDTDKLTTPPTWNPDGTLTW